MVTIKKQLVSKELADKITYQATNKQKCIVIHETANTAKGASAQAHANLQSNGNSRKASWHYQADHIEIIQSFPHEESVWAAGLTANLEGIHIEICVNQDGDFKKAVQNAVELVKHIMKEENIKIENVKQHNYFTGKNCPTNLRNGSKGITWNNFISMVKEQPAPKKKRLKVKVDVLNYYDGPRWDKPTGTVKLGTVLTIAEKVKVDNAYQYKTISGTYLTANEKYIELL